MHEKRDGKRWIWPAAFLLLNLAALAVWFHWYAGASRELSVTAMTPAGLEIDNGKITEISIAFSHPLDPQTVSADAIRLVPPLGGKTELVDGNILRFLPREPLRPATNYTVIVSPGIRGRRGETPPRELLEFSTTRFRLESAAQVAFDRHSYTLELEFNQPIAAAELKRLLKTRSTIPGDDRERFSVRGGPASRRQRVKVDFTESAFALLTLPAGLTGAEGPLGLAKERRILLQTIGPESAAPRPDWAAGLEPLALKPEVAFLGMAADMDDDQPVVEVRATAQLDSARAAGYVKISPEIPVTFSPSYRGLTIHGDFQPGKRYRVTLAEGTPAGHAGTLAREIVRDVWFDDAPPRLVFTYGGGFLSPDGALRVPVRSRNVERFNLGIRKLYSSNLVEALLREYDEEVEEKFAEPEIVRTVRTGGQRNVEKETILDLRELAEEHPLGVYGLEIWEESRRWRSRNALVVVSDLGLSAKEGNGVFFAWATSIREGAPRGGVKLKVYSNKRQLLAEGFSGDDGACLMALPPLPAGEKPALLLGVAESGEYSFVRLASDQRSRPPATQRGKAYAKGYEVFLAAERGVYRGGEKVLLTGLVRDDKVAAVADLPFDVALLGPDRKEVRKIPVKSDRFGRVAFETALGESFPGGIYSLEARLPGQDGTLGTAMFRIADYLPENLSIAMELKEPEKDGGGDKRLWIKVSRLAGGDIGGFPVKAGVEYRPEKFAPAGWDGWVFGDARRNGSAERREYSDMLSAEGEAELSWKIPALNFPAAARMTVMTEASENGGRATTAVLGELVHDAPYYVGMEYGGETGKSGEAFALSLAAVRQDGSVMNLDAPWTGTLHRIEYSGMTRRNSRGALEYEWVRQEIPEAELSGVWTGGRSSVRAFPVAGGLYRLAVEAAGGRACMIDFSVEGPGAAWQSEDPERLALQFDKPRYAVGEQAGVSVASPFAGLALITVETDAVLSHKLVEFQEGNNQFAIPVDERMRPNAYVSVLLVRPAAAEAEWRPHRLSGTSILRVDNHDRILAVEVDAPDTLPPGKNAEVLIRVTRNGEAVPGAAVVVCGVDVGILSLTGHATPSPWDAFYRERRSGVREADMFSRLAPELTEWQIVREAAPGGDASAGDSLARRLNPVFAGRAKPAVFHDARLVTGADGIARAVLPVPEFAGRMRLMCWAASGEMMGSAEQELEVRAPVSVAAAWPRFAAPGDEMRIPVTLLNRSGADGRAIISCRGDEYFSFAVDSLAVEIGDGRAEILEVHATAIKAGVARPSLSVEMAGESFTDRVELSVRPPHLFAREAGSVLVPPESESVFTLAERLLPENSRVKILVGGSPQIGLSGSVDALLDYPYGCAEQTAARLLGLAYLPDLVRLSRPGQLESGEISLLATACVERMLGMQNANGSLRMWPSGDEEVYWVSAQALFSLTEGVSAGHPVPSKLIGNLSSYLNDRLDAQFSDSVIDADAGETLALALLGLAKADKLQRSWLLRFQEIADSSAARSRPLASSALAFFCNAVALAGDRDAALELYEKYNPHAAESGATGNRIVDLAAWLLAAMSVGHADQDALAIELAAESGDGFTRWSTRENSLVLASLGRYWQKQRLAPDAKARVIADGESTEFSTRKGFSRVGLRAGSTVEIDNPSQGDLRVFWLAEGAPLSGKVREEDKGLKARRRIFAPGGQEILKPFELSRGEVYEIRLTIEGVADDLVLVDMLPAGLEIEDASLKGRRVERVASGGLSVKNVEIKDDRLLVFASLSDYGEYRYLVRAVTGGYFSWPALDAGRMYDSGARSVSGAGKVKITGGNEAANDR